MKSRYGNPIIDQIINQMQTPRANQSAVDSTSSDPFYAGAQRAIESARKSFGLSQEQKQNALTQGINQFSEALAKGNQERLSGSGNKLGTIAQGLSGFSKGYGDYNRQAETENETMHDKYLQQQLARENMDAKHAMDQQNILKDIADIHHRDKQLGISSGHLTEAERHNRELEALGKIRSETPRSGHGVGNAEGIDKALDLAEQEIIALGEKGERSWAGRVTNDWLPGGLRLDKDQSAINALGDIIRGKLFRAWGYRNQAEFEHVPTISADNSPEANLAIIRKLKEMLGAHENTVIPNMQETQAPIADKILMIDPATGEQDYIPRNRLEEAISDGLQLVE